MACCSIEWPRWMLCCGCGVHVLHVWCAVDKDCRDWFSVAGVLCERTSSVWCAQRCKDCHTALCLAQNKEHIYCSKWKTWTIEYNITWIIFCRTEISWLKFRTILNHSCSSLAHTKGVVVDVGIHLHIIMAYTPSEHATCWSYPRHATSFILCGLRKHMAYPKL